MISKQDLDQKFDELKIELKNSLKTEFDQFKDEYIKYIKTTSEDIAKNVVQQVLKHSLEFEDEVMIKPGARFLFFTGLRSRISDLEKRMEILEGIG